MTQENPSILDTRADGGVDWELSGTGASRLSEGSAGGKAVRLRDVMHIRESNLRGGKSSRARVQEMKEEEDSGGGVPQELPSVQRRSMIANS